jgi:hypothetical protein
VLRKEHPQRRDRAFDREAERRVLTMVIVGARMARSISSPGTGDTAPHERRRPPPSRRVRLLPGPGLSASRTATTELTVTASGVGLDHKLRDHTVVELTE